MTEAPPTGPRVRVLTNALHAHSNPWVTAWLDASRAAGLDVADLSAANVLARGVGAPAGVHLQWPERMLNPESPRAAGRLVLRLLVLCAVLRLRRRRVLLTAHNVTAHERRHPALSAVLWWVLDRLVTDVHAMSVAGRPEVEAAHPPLARRRWHVVPLGDYLAKTASAPSRDVAREELGVPEAAKVVASFGMLRRYKGIGDLLDAFGGWPDPDGRLLVAGRAADAGDARELHRTADQDDRVHLTTGYLDEPDLLRLVAAADIAVLPYRAVLNSSSAFYALSAQRPVLVPRTPTFTELSERVGHGWVRTYDGTLTTDDVAASFDLPAPARPPDLSWCSWDRIAEGIARMWGSR